MVGQILLIIKIASSLGLEWPGFVSEKVGILAFCSINPRLSAEKDKKEEFKKLNLKALAINGERNYYKS